MCTHPCTYLCTHRDIHTYFIHYSSSSPFPLYLTEKNRILLSLNPAFLPPWQACSVPLGPSLTDQSLLLFLCFFFFFNWSIVGLQCVSFWCTAKWFSYTYVCIYIFFSIMVYYRMLNIVPCAIRRTLLFIYFTFSSLYLLISNSQFIPSSPPFPFSNRKFVFHVSESVL